MNKIQRIISQGYVVLDDGSVEHRSVYKKHHGKIPAGWIVHHIDCTRDNNKIENLIALPEKFHIELHRGMAAQNRIFQRDEIETRLNARLGQVHILLKKHARLKDELSRVERSLGSHLRPSQRVVWRKLKKKK